MRWHPPMVTRRQRREAAYYLRVAKHLTFREIAEQLGVTRERVRQYVEKQEQIQRWKLKMARERGWKTTPVDLRVEATA